MTNGPICSLWGSGRLCCQKVTDQGMRPDPTVSDMAQGRAGRRRVADWQLRSASPDDVVPVVSTANTFNGKAPEAGKVPEAPEACQTCGNAGFVSAVLDDLGRVLTEAKHYRAQLQQMSSRVLSAHEGERKRIARELHDDTAQALTSILVRLRLLGRSARDQELLRNVEELRELTAGALDSVRRMAMDLRPAALDDLGLVPALQAYAEKYSQNWPVSVTVSVDGLSRRLPADVELVLYRVVQEALTNVAKHSRTSSALVSFSRRQNEVILSIEDSGVGFDLTDGPRTDDSRLGLFGMQERLALVGGEVQVQSARGKGTKITARVPLSTKRGKTGRAA